MQGPGPGLDHQDKDLNFVLQDSLTTRTTDTTLLGALVLWRLRRPNLDVLA